MTWLLRLYPRAWRRRYGAEVAELLAGRGFSLRTSIDLVAGAIDVWLHPSVTLAAAAAAAPQGTQEKTMLSRILGFNCAGAYGPGLAREDAWKAGASMIVTSLLLTIGWIVLRTRLGDTVIVESLAVMPFMVSVLLSMRYTYLKGRSTPVQAIFIGGATLLFAAFFILIGLIADRF